MKYLILALMPIALVFVLFLLHSFIDSFKKYVNKKTRNFFAILIESVLHVLFIYIYFRLVNYNLHATYIAMFLVLLFFAFKVDVYYDRKQIYAKGLGFTFIFLQLYSIISWWFV